MAGRAWLIDSVFAADVRAWVRGWFEDVEWSADQHQRRRRQPDEAALPWSVLWLLPGAPQEVVRAAYRALARLHHPDAGGDEAAMKRLNAAYAALQLEEARRSA